MTTKKNNRRKTTKPRAAVKPKTTQPAKTTEKLQVIPVEKKRQTSALRSYWASFWQYTKQSVVYSPWYGRTLLAMAVFLLIMKMILVYTAFGASLIGESVGETLINYISILASDFMIVGLIFVGAFLNAVIRKKRFKRYVNITALLLMLLYVSDMFSIYYFQSRFYLVDLLQFFSLKNSASYVLYPFVWALIFVAVLFVIFLLMQRWFPVIRRKNMHLRTALVFFAICVLFSGVNLLTTTDFHFRNNVLAINIQEISALLNKENAELLPGRELKSYEDYFVPMAGKKRTGDVIILFAESFSAVDSKKSGGIHDYLTGFDAIASEGRVYTNFIANGCTSETAHIALLQGVEPWESVSSNDNYKSYKQYTETLPAFFKGLGYKTTFISTAPLSFLHQRDFLKQVGFDTLVGEESFIAGPKYVFNAAPDKDLYTKALDVIRTRDTKKPMFLSLQTISSHKPYSSPAGTSERAAMTYSDMELKRFYDELKKSGYFNHGTLIIVGDHRKMEPLEREEFQKWGASANGRTVMSIVGPGIEPGEIDEDIVQHIDVFSSLKYLYGSGQVTINNRFNDILGNYEGRKQAIRYCQYVERQYVATTKANESWTITAKTDKHNLAYINAFKNFQQNTGTLAKDLEEIEALKKQKGIIVIGHQGSPMMAAPNSYGGFILAKQQGADGIEFDLSTTKDGYNVVMHGPDIGRTQCKNSAGKKNVSDFTLKEMKDNCTLFNGEPVLTFAEALQKTEGQFSHYFVDIKVYDDAKVQQQMDEIFEVVDELDMEKVAILSSYHSTGNKILNSKGRKFTIAWDTFDSSDYTRMKDANHKYFMLPFTSYKPFMVNCVSGLKKEAVTYTINNVQDLQKAYDMGIRIIMTDNIPMVIERLRGRPLDQVH